MLRRCGQRIKRRRKGLTPHHAMLTSPHQNSRRLWRRDLMRMVSSGFVGVTLAVFTSTGAMAQSYYDDQACRQYADQQIAPLRDQVNSQAVGSALLGAGVGAAIGGAV